MKDYQKYINALRKCAKEREYDRRFTGHIIVSDLCRDTADLLETMEQKTRDDMGEISDGYHTFNELYYQRAILFATIVNLNKDKAWKSFKHFDGKYCFDSNGDWFIVGIDTPEGNYTYHYSKEYWNMFNCKELECGKEWDGHTEKDVTRLLSLVKEPMWIPVTEDVPPKGTVCLWCNEKGNIFVSEITSCLESISYVGKHGYFSNGLENYGNIVAWMPLPKAYKD